MNAASLKDAGAGLLLLCSSPPLPLPVEERQGLGGKVRAALTPSFPRVGAEVGQEEGEGATLPLPLPQRGRGRGLGGR
jgi:hypothetical protein